MSEKHTPAPWHFNQLVGRDDAYAVLWTSAGPLGSMTRNLANRGELRKADARLISAAPELLDAANDALCVLENSGYDYVVSRLRAAIDKATGEQQ